MEWDICGLVKKMNYKKINKSNLYTNFFFIYTIISCTYLFLIKKQTKDIFNKGGYIIIQGHEGSK